jgi:hypothetical protein
MPLYYNIEPANAPIVFKAGDTIDISFAVYLNGVLFHMTGMQIDVKFRRKDGLLVKSLSSAGIGAAITIALSTYNMYSAGFLVPDVLDYDVQITDGADVFTVQEGECFVKKQIT